MSEVKPLPWELPPVNIVHDPALDITFVDPFAKFAETRKVEVSPEQFDVVRRELVRADAAGFGPTASAAIACEAAGIETPKPFCTVALVVNPLLVRDSVTGLLPGQADPLDVPTFLRRCKP